MMRRLLLAGLFALTLAVGASGCCVDACGTRRGPLGRPFAGPMDCECGGVGCGHCGRAGFGPLQYAKYRATCGAGCGEMYLGEWSSDPPDCCDPCDQCGNYVGPNGCCGRSFLLGGWRNLWGRRYSPGGYDGGGYGDEDMMFDEGEVVYNGDVAHGGEMVYDESTMEDFPATGGAGRQVPTPAARQMQSAIKKAGARQPYYDEAQRPTTMSRAPGFRTAARPQPINTSSRSVRP